MNQARRGETLRKAGLSVAAGVKAAGDRALRRNRPTRAVLLYSEASALYRQMGERLGEGECLLGIAQAQLLESGDDAWPSVCKRAAMALRISREQGDRRLEAFSLLLLGEVRATTRREDEGRLEEYLEKALGLFSELGDVLGTAHCLRAQAELLKRFGRPGARRRFQAASGQYSHAGDRLGRMACELACLGA